MSLPFFEDEATLITYTSCTLVVLALATFIAEQFLRAPYGRYSSEASRVYGPPIPASIAWFIQEVPSFAVPLICIYYGKEECIGSLVNRILLGMFLLHYLQRAFIFPFLIRGGKPTPLMIMFMSIVFCLTNGYIQGRYLTYYAKYDETWMSDPRFIFGVAGFFTGMYINIRADSILRNLRKPGEKGYKIPRGGMFEYISGANFFGEILEWAGFALAAWSLPAFAFALFTFCNIGPRGAQHHKWYLEKFKGEYPKNRKGVIPFIW